MADETTIGYYEQNAASFVAGTVEARVSEALEAFVELVPAGGRVLDWGCGSGRDSRVLRERGFAVCSVDASAAMAQEALRATGTVVRVEEFCELREVEAYDGIWACASLLHVRPEELPAVLNRGADALKAGGVLYCSFKWGDFAGYRGGRWYTDLDENALAALLEPRFDVLRMWRSSDVRPQMQDTQWVNCLARKR